jgi:conjugal transfer pilus assembly protein TraB
LKLLDSLNTKQKQRLVLVTIIVVVLGFIYLVTSGLGNRRAKKITQQAPKKFSLLSDKVDKDMWVAAQGENIKALQQSAEQAQSQIKNLTDELSSFKQELGKEEKAKGAGPGKQKTRFPPLPVPLSTDATAHASFDRKIPVNGPSAFPPIPQAHGAPPVMFNDTRRLPNQRLTAPVSPIHVFQDDDTNPRDKKAQQKQKKKEDTSIFLPPSFMKAVLLNGLDAPTSGSSQAEPYPVLMAVTGLTTMPNLYKMNLRECFIIGAGYGNLSDERCYIRTESLSCVRSDGGVIDAGLKGEVIGEDGKLGMRGRLVSRQGQQLAMAILSGSLSGLGEALRPQQSLSLNLNPASGASVSTIPTKTVLEDAAEGGIGNALNKVADFYLSMAKKIYPVVEVDAGRHIEIMVLKGQSLRIEGKPTSQRGRPKDDSR